MEEATQSKVSRKDKPLITHSKILIGASKLFCEHGYEGMTIRRLAKEIGMTTGAVYARFTCKGEIFNELFLSLRGQTEIRRHTWRAMSIDSLQQRLLNILSIDYEGNHQYIWLLRIYITKLLNGEDATYRILERWKEDVSNYIDDILEIYHHSGTAKERLRENIWDAHLITCAAQALPGSNPEQLQEYLRRHLVSLNIVD